MIRIKKSETADTRTCDFSKVTKETLRQSSVRHIGDICLAMDYFIYLLSEAGYRHDVDKLTRLDQFHADFVTGFRQTSWWDNHRRISRHHLNERDGVPGGVNLIDVLEYIADCVMAGMARSGSVYHVEIDPVVLEEAFRNTVDLLKNQVVVEPSKE